MKEKSISQTDATSTRIMKGDIEDGYQMKRCDEQSCVAASLNFSLLLMSLLVLLSVRLFS